MRILRPVLFLCLTFGISLCWSTAQERDNPHSRNYQNCLYGRYGCDPAQLTTDEQSAVARAAHERNYQNCLYGRYGCDLAQLTANEQPVVARAAHDRNYQNCLYGRYGCDASRLSADEQLAVAHAAHDRNYQNCLHSRYGCDQTQLTESEKQSVSDAGRGTAAPKPSTTQTTPPPHYYTNSAGEKVQSPTYSNTVPAAATAQCRDGTYSFSHNHRGTCSHHGGVSRWLD